MSKGGWLRVCVTCRWLAVRMGVQRCVATHPLLLLLLPAEPRAQPDGCYSSAPRLK